MMTDDLVLCSSVKMGRRLRPRLGERFARFWMRLMLVSLEVWGWEAEAEGRRGGEVGKFRAWYTIWGARRCFRSGLVFEGSEAGAYLSFRLEV